ncbi:unnamed protein product [Nippostrongylus brasiliensis]|uniref:HTH_Tnp_Tc3_1 domain-containing protein n=1 Tax=Nippostrongylus brasiliensis TaxID=27835 RepID=A0A0N4XYU3_NIPBR|nr:unnamed protein product [Nippostrongylus brasiliensis]
MPIRGTALSFEEQAQIRALKESGLSNRAIARQLDRPQGCVNRYLRDPIGYLTWPACSLDCNPMNSMWGIVFRQVYADNKQFSKATSATT